MLLLIKKILDRAIEWICIFIVGLMTVLITYQVVVRYVFNSPSAVSEILSRYLFVWLILFAGAYVFGLREHMEIAFLKNKFPPKLQVVADSISEIVIATFAIGVMIIGGYSATVRQMFQLDSALQIPIGVIYSAIPISGAIIVFYSICNLATFYHCTKK
ncbi:C4-dicarboxylate ABC transporter permease [Gallibacterium genomosp. 2]|uniref:TRAP transporter small permease protein n=2 Tax=Gallibacterium TaxID=155493 RepID=A0A0A2XNP7_9PAST|nr:C4-dicarboxylate ABC transporter permease [Gallibacterium genomosp. 2]KGQ38148.1 C4-dicarboxylate ABC transporter permease [Gallibacterium genomosp. 1]KGQ59838.1 C4-dicarboxylate ABC transporter permease [Gallibacterium anatis]KGQ67352.1 C4-dicarboxylate ABC transporter permease [Gallibacterium anatis]OBX03063.1 C4-dicarboxylate ABC transporter permease [Gallibacterium genomosp. 1]